MRFLHPERDSNLELAIDDVFIVPGFHEGGSRRTVDLSPPDFAGGSHPVVSANMNAVTGKRMAETIARYGGLGILPQDMAPETVERIVRHVKAASPRFDTPLVVDPKATLRDVLGIIRKRAHGLVVVVDENRRPIGIASLADIREHDQYSPVGKRMSREVITITEPVDHRAAFTVMEEERVKAAPVVNDDGQLTGIITRDDAVRFAMQSPATDTDGRLMVGAALSIGEGVADTAERFVCAGVDVLVLDTAHGYQRRMLDAVAAVRAAIGERVPLVAGNVCTAEGTRALIEAGADVVKVNVGPGAMCTTRMQTGAGRPTFSAARACALEASEHGKHIWADGGVRFPRDVALYLAAGAARVMVGTMFAGTLESPGDIRTDEDGHLYKENFGMASARAVNDRTASFDAFEKAKHALFEEGISSSRIYLKEGRESLGDGLFDVLSGLRSSFTYVGATDWAQLQASVVIGVQTASGYSEGTPHGRVRR